MESNESNHSENCNQLENITTEITTNNHNEIINSTLDDNNDIQTSNETMEIQVEINNENVNDLINNENIKLTIDENQLNDYEFNQQLQEHSIDLVTNVVEVNSSNPVEKNSIHEEINDKSMNEIMLNEQSSLIDDINKQPQRPPPPKPTSTSLSYTDDDDHHHNNNDNNNNNTVSINDVMKVEVINDQNEIDQSMISEQLIDDPHDHEHPNQHKRPSLKSNIKHAFTNIRKSFKREDKSSMKHVDEQHMIKNDKLVDNSQQRQQYHMTTYKYKVKNNLSNSPPPPPPPPPPPAPPAPPMSTVYQHRQYYQTVDELHENQSQMSNTQSLNISLSDSSPSLIKRKEDIEIVNSLEIIAPPAIPTKMSSDPNNPIYVNHSIRPNRPPTIDRKEIDEHGKHIYANSRELNEQKAKEFTASAIVDSVISNYEDYWTNDLHNRKTYSQPTNINYRQDYITRSEQTTPKQPIKSHIHLSNDYNHKLQMTSDNNNYYYTQSQLSSPKPTRPIHPPLLSPMDYVIHNKHDIDKQRLDMINSMHKDNKFIVDDHEQYNDTIGYHHIENSDYPSRFRERIHTYQPTHTATTLSYNNEFNQNGTLKAYKPKIKAEQYKCSEVYSWPPKFPKLKRRKTNPPKQIHTGQEHIVIKQQLRTSAPVIRQNESNTEPIHCIKVNNQYQPSNYKADRNASPERQVTSLHSLQRSTLLEKSNRNSGTESRDQLLIADYKQMPGNQIGESMKANTLALPYYTKMLSNKQFNKFHSITKHSENNDKNNIVVSSDVLRSDSLKSSHALHDAMTTIYALLQCNQQSNNIMVNNNNGNNNKEEYKKLLIHCLSEYLFSCMKLYSLDLHGDYATFVYPLKYFNEQLWYKYGYIDHWYDVIIVCEPNTNYEYVLLNEFSTTIKFPTKTFDKLLTNWLDNQTTKTPLTHNSFVLNTKKTNSKEKTSDEKLLHSITIATTLKTVLNSFEKQQQMKKIIKINMNMKETMKPIS
ncbi:hypothetical protein KSF78_0008556 [Schistosoma japonicum]|nr:hypothetical protein KSF78_0008556 [Schistosoma japonicum]